MIIKGRLPQFFFVSVASPFVFLFVFVAGTVMSFFRACADVRDIWRD